MENPYAPPKDISETQSMSHNDHAPDVFREGDMVVCAQNAVWPDRCVVCNEPTNSPKITRKLFWHPGWVYLLFLISWLIYVIVAAIVRKKGIIHISLCDFHRKRRTRGILIATVGFVTSLIFIIVAAAMSESNESVYGFFAIIGGIGLIATPITGLVMARNIIPRKITNEQLWIRAGKPFTESL